MLTTSLLMGLAAIVAALGSAAYCLPAADRPTPRSRMNTAAVPGWPHEAPFVPFTVAQAHQVMRQHKTCRRSDCARKDAAWMVLVDAGIIVPRMPLIGGVR